MDAKEIRAEIKEIGSRVDGRIEMFYEEVKNTESDLIRLRELYNELEQTTDDPVFKMGCRGSMNEISARVRLEYNQNISKIFRLYY